MSQKNSLEEYKKKRHFKRTPEPSGGRGKASRKPKFVVQKHDASNLHYDFRLEINNVLVSWAVPKGPSTDAKEKRLAMRTEDHPLEYADFEGVIPKGEYGAGTVQVWDAGTYQNLKEPNKRGVTMSKGLADGHFTFWLKGQKLKGGYALTRIGKGKRWLLVKMKGEEADPHRNPVKTEPRSVISGRTLEEIAREEK